MGLVTARYAETLMRPPLRLAPLADVSIDFWPEDGMTLISLCSSKRHLAVLAAASFHLVDHGISVNQVSLPSAGAHV
eukprot:3712166-Pyramimonas_sp.AAC.2